MEARTKYVTLATALVVAVPVAVWWLVGDLSTTATDPDYIVKAPELPTALVTGAGVVALLVVAGCAATLATGWSGRTVRRISSATVVPLCVAGAIVAGGGRMITAGTIGANIGGGLVLLLGFPLAALLVLGAALNAWMVSRDAGTS